MLFIAFVFHENTCLDQEMSLSNVNTLKKQVLMAVEEALFSFVHLDFLSVDSHNYRHDGLGDWSHENNKKNQPSI